MLPSWISNSFRSYLGDCIYHTEVARYNDAKNWYRTLMNLGFSKTDELIRLARFIRYGVLSSSEASQVFYDRLSKVKKSRYSLMIYYIENDWLPESHFYFKKIDWSWLVEDLPVSTGLFP